MERQCTVCTFNFWKRWTVNLVAYSLDYGAPKLNLRDGVSKIHPLNGYTASDKEKRFWKQKIKRSNDAWWSTERIHFTINK